MKADRIEVENRKYSMCIDIIEIENALYKEYLKIRTDPASYKDTALYILGKIDAYRYIARGLVWDITAWENFDNLYDKCRAELANRFNI